MVIFPKCEETAFHEAGHAVAQIELGHTFSYMVVYPAPGQNGRCRGHVEPDPESAITTNEDSARRLVMWCMAGVVAKHHHMGGHATSKMFKAQAEDWVHALPMIRFLAEKWHKKKTDESIEKTLEELLNETKQMLTSSEDPVALKRWAAIESLAQKALERSQEPTEEDRRIYFDEAKSIVQNAMR